MRRARVVSAAAAAAAFSLVSSVTKAANYTWVGASGASWGVTTNWTGNPGNVPNSLNDNVFVNGAAQIAVPGGFTLNSIQLGVGGATIDVGNANSGGGTLTFDGGFAAPGAYAHIVSLGGPTASNTISSPIVINENGFSSGTLNGGNTSNVGSFNPVQAFVSVQSQPLFTGVASVWTSLAVDPSSTASVTLSGLVTQQVGVQTGLGNGMVSTTQQLVVSGGIQISNSTSTVGQTFDLGGASGSQTVISGTISDGTTTPGTTHGQVQIGAANPSKNTFFPTVNPTVTFNGTNTYTGATRIDMGTLVVGSNQAFGELFNPTTMTTAPWTTADENNPANVGTVANVINTPGTTFEYGDNIMSAADNLSIPQGMAISEELAFKGSHSLTINGYIVQSGSGRIVNLLPTATGKSLTLAGPVYGTITLDGSGTTTDTGSIFNSNIEANDSPVGATPVNTGLSKQGTGTAFVQGTNSTYRGGTNVSGGVLDFASAASYGVQTTGYVGIFPNGAVDYPSGNVGTSGITVSTGGAVGVDTGATTTPGFLALFTSANNTGAIALSSADAGATIDYTSATSFNTTGLVGTGIGALPAGVTFNGTITPAATGYRLGGGGTLTMSASSTALTGAVPLTVINGGAVVLNNPSSNYTGVTTVQSLYVTSVAAQATNNDFGVNFAAPLPMETQTLAVAKLSNGGLPSSIGSSSSAASNLVLSGSTLQYLGSGDSTDRLFTMTPTGATLDASGTGAVDFTNAGAIVEVDVPPVTGVGTTLKIGTGAPFNNVTVTGVSNLNYLTQVMTLTDTTGGIVAGSTINEIQPGNVLFLSQPIAAGTAGDTITFGNQNRTLTLTGTNTALNTLTPAITDSGAGIVAVNKTGTGTWVIAGADTYSGGTTVNAGTLVAGSATALPTGKPVSVASGATLRLGTGIGGQTFASTALTIASGGTFDLSNNHAFITYGGTDPATTILAQVKSGAAGGAWNGVGINSSTAAVTSGYGVAYADGADGIATSLTSGQIEVAYALLGDIKLTGAVNALDFGILAGNFGKTVTGGWEQGDLNYDGVVNAIDFGDLAGNFGKTATGAAVALPAADWAALDSFAAANGLLADVPEPASMGLMIVAGAGILARRRRKI